MTTVDVGPPAYGRIPAPFGAPAHVARRWPSGHTEILTGLGDWVTFDYPYNHERFIPEEDEQS